MCVLVNSTCVHIQSYVAKLLSRSFSLLILPRPEQPENSIRQYSCVLWNKIGSVYANKFHKLAGDYRHKQRHTHGNHRVVELEEDLKRNSFKS